LNRRPAPSLEAFEHERLPRRFVSRGLPRIMMRDEPGDFLGKDRTEPLLALPFDVAVVVHYSGRGLYVGVDLIQCAGLQPGEVRLEVLEARIREHLAIEHAEAVAKHGTLSLRHLARGPVDHAFHLE